MLFLADKTQLGWLIWPVSAGEPGHDEKVT
jgi:hypothetical protein